MHLQDHTILITGATSGIGMALAYALSQRGNHIVAVGRNSEKLRQLSRDLPLVTTHNCDLADRRAIAALVDDLMGNSINVSVLINNAAVQPTPSFTDPDFDLATIENEIAVNLTAPALLAALLLPTLCGSSRGAAIVNLSSGLALYPKSGSAIYCATKAAIHSLSWSWRYQLVGRGVRVHEVILPLVDTPMTAGRGRGKLAPRRVAADIIAGIEKGHREIHVGKARWLPVLNRLSPSLTRRLLKTA